MSLFDADDYRSPQDSGREPRVRRQSGMRWFQEHKRNRKAIPSDGDWWIIATTAGPLEFVHRVAEKVDYGSVITKCDQVGRPLRQLEEGTTVIPCEACLDVTE